MPVEEVRTWSRVSPTHAVTPALVIELSELLSLLSLFTKSAGAARLFFSWVWGAIGGDVRWLHFQRSHVVGEDEDADGMSGLRQNCTC